MNKLLLLGSAVAFVYGCDHADAQPAMAQQVVPGYLSPVTPPAQGPTFVPSLQAGSALNELTVACSATTASIAALATATVTEVIQNSGSGPAYMSFNGATPSNASFSISAGTTITFGPQTGYVPQTVQAYCETTSTTLNVLFK